MENSRARLISKEQLILEIIDPNFRENAIFHLCQRTDIFQDLPPLLWNSFGTIAALLQEILSVYPVLSQLKLTEVASNRVC
ncbi:hypothetical protein GIB67_019226, partial [Kingdonia uniflora]